MPESPNKLLGCPFCGEGRSQVSLYQDDYDLWTVGCGACGSHSGKGKNKTAIVNLWNRRHDQQHKHSDAVMPPQTEEARNNFVNFVGGGCGITTKTSVVKEEEDKNPTPWMEI